MDKLVGQREQQTQRAEDTSRSYTHEESDVNIKSVYQEPVEVLQAGKDTSGLVSRTGNPFDSQSKSNLQSAQNVRIRNQRTRNNSTTQQAEEAFSEMSKASLIAAGSQTDPGAYIKFACNMFLNEVNEAIKDEKELQTLKEF